MSSRARRSACWAGLAGMITWAVGVALIPLDAKLENGQERLTATLAGVAPRLYLAGLLAVLGGVLLVVFFVMLCRLIPERGGSPDAARLALAACVVTQTMVGVGAGCALVAVHSARAGADAGLVAVFWRGLWLVFLASAVPTVIFTVPAVMAMAATRLVPAWVTAFGWLSAAAHVVVMFTFAQSGAFAPDGIVGALTPLTTVFWIVGAAVVLLRSDENPGAAPT